MKNNRYKILVLSDLKNSTNSTLRSGVSLAKMIDGDVDFFHVKKATEIVEGDSQLSAIRTINKLHITMSTKIQHLIDTVSKDYDIKISHTHAFGNVKSEISEYIQVNKPDIVVIGKRKSNPFNFIGDNITDFVMKNHDGAIMIASDENTFEPNKDFSLGVLNDIEKSFNIEFADSLISHSQKPLKLFKIGKQSKALSEKEKSIEKKTVEYVFEQSDNAINNLFNYLSKNSIDLLCLNRESKNGKIDKDVIKIDINEIIYKMNISLLIAGNQKHILN